MKSKSINDPYHNPFHNRFHVPVHSRLDEMQAFTQMTWLNDRASNDQDAGDENAPKTQTVRTAVLCCLCFFAAVLLFRFLVA
jgi:hypothetical protein